jgi:arginine-tRNA-protein transferase
LTSEPRDAPQFYLTSPSPCPYLPGKEERKVFTHLIGRRAASLNNALTESGFRRSQTIAYRPACEDCRACVSVRVAVNDFRPTRNMRRVMERNGDLVGGALPARPTSEQYSLFRRYLDSRHSDGGMADMNVLDYTMMIEDSHVETRIVEYRRHGPDTAITGRGQGPLQAVCLTDVLADGLSMVYSFYDPEQSDRSLGTYMILEHIERARRLGLPHLYLGYWVEGSRKMAYKGRFLPQERLGLDGWIRIEKDGDAPRSPVADAHALSPLRPVAR